MPKSATVLLIRHAEKPDTGPKLAPAGQARAQAYIAYFKNYPVKLAYLFAAADSDESHRPRLTLEPLAASLDLDINTKHKDKDFQEVAGDLLQHGKYDHANTLICWHHGQALALAAALGVDPSKLPDHWPGEVFGWLLQIRYDAAGAVDPAQTLWISQQLMYGDCGQSPPGA